jgi:heptose I phosphotransferase
MSENLFHRLLHGVRRIRQQPRWSEFAGPDWPQQIMHVAGTDRFHAKQGRTIVRWELQSGNRRLVVYLKRHYRLPWWSGLLALVWPGGNWSPAMQEWEHLQWARAQGLPAPEALAAGEFIGPWGKLQSFLAVEELTGMLPLHEAIPAAEARLDPRAFQRWKRALIDEMVSLTLDLHRRHWFHKDLYFCHFYIAVSDTARLPDWRGRVWLIDFHRLGHHPWTWRWWRAKDLGQLLYSSHVPGVTARDRLRFWRAYLAADRLGWTARWIQRSARIRATNHQRHHDRKVQEERKMESRPGRRLAS